MSENSTYKDIRSRTLLALPEDDSYLFRLGIAVYGFASINSFMCEVISHINKNYNHTTLQDKESGKILAIFRREIEELILNKQYIEIHKTANETADLFEDLNSLRNDIIHTYPITNPNGNQILHRRKDKARKYFEVSNNFLDKFISQLHEASRGLYEIRYAVRSEK